MTVEKINLISHTKFMLRTKDIQLKNITLQNDSGVKPRETSSENASVLHFSKLYIKLNNI